VFETLVNIDWGLFKAINGLHSEFWDTIMWWFTEKITWVPLYIFLAVLLYRKFGRLGLIMIAFSALLILISDQTSGMLKDLFQRERPCHNDALAFDIHLVRERCGGLYGFVSSHAANTMALAVYVLLLTKARFRWVNRILLFYVLVVSYSRVYMGNHFPADIVGGWMIGIFAAFITYYFYRSVAGEKFDMSEEP
jgi:undecaprenyl-diphosphatase